MCTLGVCACVHSQTPPLLTARALIYPVTKTVATRIRSSSLIQRLHESSSVVLDTSARTDGATAVTFFRAQRTLHVASRDVI